MVDEKQGQLQNSYNTWDGDEIIYELADRIGILTGPNGMLDWISNRSGPVSLELDINRRHTKKEVSEARLNKAFGPPDLPLDAINDANGPHFMVRGGGPANYSYFFMPENATRHPMYMILLKQVREEMLKNLEDVGLDHIPGWEGQMDYWMKAWDPVPTWVPSREFDAPDEYDLNVINYKTVASPFKLGEVNTNPWIYETFKTYDPYEYSILVNTKTAKEKGLKDGETIVVEFVMARLKAR